MRLKSTALLMGVLTGAIAVAPAAFAQEHRGTMEQQMACTPDVRRLCSDQIPDEDRIVACLRQNTPQLSDGCRAVFETNGRADPAPHRSRRPPAPAEPVQPQPRDDDWFR